MNETASIEIELARLSPEAKDLLLSRAVAEGRPVTEVIADILRAAAGGLSGRQGGAENPA